MSTGWLTSSVSSEGRSWCPGTLACLWATVLIRNESFELKAFGVGLILRRSMRVGVTLGGATLSVATGSLPEAALTPDRIRDERQIAASRLFAGLA